MLTNEFASREILADWGHSGEARAWLQCQGSLQTANVMALLGRKKKRKEGEREREKYVDIAHEFLTRSFTRILKFLIQILEQEA